MSTLSNDQPYPDDHHLTSRSSDSARSVPPAAGRPDSVPASTTRDLAATAIEARARRRSRTRLGRRLSQVLGRSRGSARELAMLDAEADRIGPGRDPDQATHGETLVLRAAAAAGNGVLARSQRIIDKRAEDIEDHQVKRVELLARARSRVTDRVRHPDGGLRSVQEVARDEQEQRAQIENDRASGSRMHQRLPWWIGRIPRLVLVADSCLLLYFFAGITDVNWSSPMSADLVFAVLLAAMVTVLSYGFLAFAGHRLRSHKDHSGAIPLADLDGLTKIAAAAAIAAIGILAALMFTRMRTEVLYALGPGSGGTALLVALTLAAVSALANFLVIAIHALDGSDQAARLEALSRATSRPLAEAREMQVQADLIPSRIAVLRRRAVRDAVRAVTGADKPMTAAARTINAAHARHQAAGPHPRTAADAGQDRVVAGQDRGAAGYHDPATAPAPDLRQLTTALDHIHAELPDVNKPEFP